ncbi:MAG: ABC transporter permease [Dehalococcoidia bacterium]
MASEVAVLSVRVERPEERPLPARVGRTVLRFTRAKPLGAVGALIIVVMVVMALAAPIITSYDYAATNPREKLQAPSAKHWLGTDQIGRDLYTRIVYGARVALFVGLCGTLLGVGTGSLIGLVSGYFGGKLDMVLMRVVDSLQAFPGLILAMALVAVLGYGLEKAFIAIAITLMPRPARVVRGSVLGARAMPWVEAAHTVGVPDRRILFRHILPNVFAPIMVLASLVLGIAILTEASLSFLGLGVQPPTPAWGSMLSGAGANYFETYPHMAIVPGVAISLAVFAFNLFGDALRDVLDPRLRGS